MPHKNFLYNFKGCWGPTFSVTVHVWCMLHCIQSAFQFNKLYFVLFWLRMGPGDIELNGLRFWKAYLTHGKNCLKSIRQPSLGPLYRWGNGGPEMFKWPFARVLDWRIERCNPSLESFGLILGHHAVTRGAKVVAENWLLVVAWPDLWMWHWKIRRTSEDFISLHTHPPKEKTNKQTNLWRLLKKTLKSDNAEPVRQQGKTGPPHIPVPESLIDVTSSWPRRLGAAPSAEPGRLK